MRPSPPPSLLLGTLLFLATALPTALAHETPSPSTPKTNFQFSNCVANCVASSGCPDTSSSTCVCRPPLLSDITTCLFYFCPSSLRAFTTQFLDKVDNGCDAAGRTIPSKELDKLEKAAKSLVAKLPKPTSSTTTSSRTTSSSAARTTTKAVEPTTTPPAVVPVPVPEPSTPPTTFVQSASSTEAAPRRGPTDTSPFGNVRKAEAARGGWRGTGWVVAPLVAAAMVL